MSKSTEHSIADLLDRDNVLVLVIPRSEVSGLFSRSPQDAADDFEQDFTVAQYKERFEPNRSESRIREICSTGAFPDTTAASGEVIPGAYKDRAGDWRITMEGILARQRRERAHGLEQRRREDERRRKDAKKDGAEGKPPTPRKRPQNKRQDASPSSGPVGDGGGSSRKKGPSKVSRPKKGAWRKAIAEQNSGTASRPPLRIVP